MEDTTTLCLSLAYTGTPYSKRVKYDRLGFFFSIKWSPDTAQDNDIKTLKTRQIIKLLLKMALKFDIKFAERLYLSNVSRNGVVSSSAVYSEATLILSSCCEGRAQQITASDVIAMEKVRVPKL